MNMVGLAHLFEFIGYGHQLSSQEDFILYECLASSTSGTEIFKVLKKYSNYWVMFLNFIIFLNLLEELCLLFQWWDKTVMGKTGGALP